MPKQPSADASADDIGRAVLVSSPVFELLDEGFQTDWSEPLGDLLHQLSKRRRVLLKDGTPRDHEWLVKWLAQQLRLQLGQWRGELEVLRDSDDLRALNEPASEGDDARRIDFARLAWVPSDAVLTDDDWKEIDSWKDRSDRPTLIVSTECRLSGLLERRVPSIGRSRYLALVAWRTMVEFFLREKGPSEREKLAQKWCAPCVEAHDPKHTCLEQLLPSVFAKDHFPAGFFALHSLCRRLESGKDRQTSFEAWAASPLEDEP